MLEHFKNIGYGQLLVDEPVMNLEGKRVFGVRGDISIANTDDLDIKGAKEEAKYLIRVSSEDDSTSFVIKGCQVDRLIFFNRDDGPEAYGDVWDLDG